MSDSVIRRVDETTWGVAPKARTAFSIWDAADLARGAQWAAAHDIRLAQRGAHFLAEAREQELKRLLGAWVSEIEPVVYLGPRGELLGLGWAGGQVLQARPITLIINGAAHV